jgi:hypothetical protein
MNYIRLTPVMDRMNLEIVESWESCAALLHIDEAHDLANAMAAGQEWSIDDGDDRLVNWIPADRTMLVGGAAYKIPAELVHRVSWALANDTSFSTEAL